MHVCLFVYTQVSEGEVQGNWLKDYKKIGSKQDEAVNRQSDNSTVYYKRNPYRGHAVYFVTILCQKMVLMIVRQNVFREGPARAITNFHLGYHLLFSCTLCFQHPLHPATERTMLHP